jgi:hypothetical protein
VQGFQLLSFGESSGSFMWVTFAQRPGFVFVCDTADQSVRASELLAAGKILVHGTPSRLVDDGDGLVAEMIQRQSAPSNPRAH